MLYIQINVVPIGPNLEATMSQWKVLQPTVFNFRGGQAP